MTKKHFVTLARRFAAMRVNPEKSPRDESYNLALNDSARLVAGVCAASNPAFDRARFLEEAGVAPVLP